MDQADWDLLHPGAIVASTLLYDYGGYRNFLVSNRKDKCKYKHGVLILDLDCVELIRLLKPKVIYSSVPLDRVDEHYIICDIISEIKVVSHVIYCYGEITNKRISFWSE